MANSLEFRTDPVAVRSSPGRLGAVAQVSGNASASVGWKDQPGSAKQAKEIARPIAHARRTTVKSPFPIVALFS